MSSREQLRAAVPLAAPRRADAGDRAAALIEARPPAAAAEPGTGTCKLTTRVRADQIAWLQDQARTYHRRHPRAPKLTIEELVRLALDHLRSAPDLDGLVARYRTG
ncbi:MAG: hypothetical protein C0501_12670 [Isosphaera sp.]|nr:hypothetical protein [Isosphaera sp.]